MNKIFGIGLSKTGTHSLHDALEILGYNINHMPSAGQINRLNEWDGVMDIPIVPIYKQLDQRFPNSKFIFTDRDVSDWLRSWRQHTEASRMEDRPNWNLLIRDLVYGTKTFDTEKCQKAFINHRDDVLQYFQDRPDDLLHIRICNNPSERNWKKICEFLGHDIPDNKFPHSNVTGD